MVHTILNQSTKALPGTGLPIYNNIDNIAQFRKDLTVGRYCPFLCPLTDLIPFQVGIPGGSPTHYKLRDAVTGIETSIAGAGFDGQCYNGSDWLLTYDGTPPAGITNGLYYFRIAVSSGGSIYSDVFSVCTEQAEKAMYITWRDDRDWVGGAYYGGGYVNKLWLETAMARPKVEYSEEVVEDGYGYQIPVYQRTEEVYQFDVLATDSMVPLLYKIAHHGDVKLALFQTYDPYSLKSVRASDTGERKDALAIVNMSFKVDFMESTTQEGDTYELGAC